MYQYDVKVRREKTYLWGGGSISTNFGSAFFLICHVEEFGEPIDLKSEKKGDQGAQPISFGTLMPGETYIVPLKSVSGVFAQTGVGKVDSTVTCRIVCPVEAT